MKRLFYFPAFMMSFFGLSSFVEKDGHVKKAAAKPKTIITIAGTLTNNLPRNVAVTMSTTIFTATMSGGTDSDTVAYDDVDGFAIQVDFAGSIGTGNRAKIYTDGVLEFNGPITTSGWAYLVVSNPAATIHVELGP